MPRSKRPPPLQAAGSLSARLPLGTPSFVRDASPHSQPQHSHIPTSASTTRHARWTLDGSHESSDSDTATTRLGSGNSSSHSDLIMASTHSNDPNQPLSIAAAKLERQNKRIAATNATLTSQTASEKHKQSTRNKGKAWKPFDFATDVNDSTHSQHVDAPVVESRVNVFRAPSQANLLSRPISRLSSHTHDSSHSESERRDSNLLELDDFQVFTGRKRARPTAAVPTHNEKPSLQHATVEATFSKRDITDVFGNELPGPGFMDGNPGSVDGQLQFIQHPNGDVSAHQWSSSRFGWENIGQFSNIRKKIEGQLAADRLKGETAWQSLQQNTLAYFRTVAKQREADAMGLQFSIKDIAACLPDTRPPSTAPTGPRRVTSKVEMPERPSTMLSRQDTQSTYTSVSNRENAAAMPPKPSFESLSRSQAAPPQLDQRLDPARYFTPAPRENVKEDPFTTAATINQPYGYNTRNNMHDPQMTNWSAYQPWVNPMAMYYPGYAMPNMGFNYNYNHIPHAPRPLYGQTNTGDLSGQGVGAGAGPPLQMQQHGFQQNQAQLPKLNTAPFARESPVRPATSVDSPLRPSDQTARATVQPAPSASSQAASPRDTRIAMREHVMKMGEHAKERTKSQANIGRTVMYDPFQDQQMRDPTPPPEPVKQEALPSPPAQNYNSLGHFPLLGLGMIPGLSELSGHGQDPFPTTLAPSVRMPFNTTSVLSENDLRDSSPDREWQRGSAEASSEQAMPLPHNSSLRQWDADSLDEWLWSGNKFARQEDFHQRIMATDATPTRRTHSTSTTNTIASARPIAPPSRFKPPPTSTNTNATPSTKSPDSNILTNRLLVPVLENLASYVQGPIEKRRDYFCQWTKAPDWAIDRSATGNDSFFDHQWGQPPERLGRDPRYQPVPRARDVRFRNFDAPRGGQGVGNVGREGRFGFGGRF